MEQLSVWLAENPIVSFTIFILASLTVPPLIERLRLPGLVGLLLAGILLGPYGLRLLNAESETVKLLSDIGKVYLMFVAGLDIDLQAFRKTRNQSLTFGFFTFAIPLMTGTAIGLGFGLGWNAAILVGSLLASHTLLAYPLLQRLGVVRSQAVTITVGATIFTDIGALLVLAICVSIHQGEFSWFQLVFQIVTLGLYALLVLVGLDRLGKVYFKRTGNDEGNQFLFILLALFLASVGAQVVQTENIVGAFLAGLAVNDVLGRSAVKEKVEFVGSVLFIPFFFIAMGLLVDVPIFLNILVTDTPLVLAIVAGLIVSKLGAAMAVRFIYRYPWAETLTMWSLSLPQVAATLAAALVGYQIGLLSAAIFNSVIVLMLVTSTLGPLLTRRYGSQLYVRAVAHPHPGSEAASPFNVVVSVHNPETEVHLVEMAGLLAQRQQGNVLPLTVVSPTTELNDPAFAIALKQARHQLDQATDIAKTLAVPIHPTLRIDRDIATGICHSASEQAAQLIVMGYGDIATLQARFLGSITEQVFRYSPVPVAVMRFQRAPLELQRVIVPLWDLRPYLQTQLQFAFRLAVAIQTSVTILYVCPPSATTAEQQSSRQYLQSLLAATSSQVEEVKLKSDIKVIPHADIATAVLQATQSGDIAVLQGQDLMPVREAIIHDWSFTLLKTLNCSVAIFK